MPQYRAPNQQRQNITKFKDNLLDVLKIKRYKVNLRASIAQLFYLSRTFVAVAVDRG